MPVKPMTMRNRSATNPGQRDVLGDWSGVIRLVAAPGVILFLFAVTVAISLGALLYAQHSSSVIVQHDMRIVTSLSQSAAAFDHQDGNLYRLMADRAVGDRRVNIPERSAAIQRRLLGIEADLRAIRPSLRPDDQRRMDQVLGAIGRYAQAVDTVSTLLDTDFAAGAAMLAPFRSNADRVIADVNAMVAVGIHDARAHAAVSAGRTRWLVALAATAMVLLAILAVAWLALASYRGLKLDDEIRLRELAESSAMVLARHDPLTNLVNRRAFVEELDRLIGLDERFAVALIDLDDFKAVNDLYGHAAGDAVLLGVAARLQLLGGEGTVLARLGGDEFAAILPQRSPEELRRAIATLSEEMRRPVPWNDTDLHVGGSIGVSLYPEHASAIDTLLHAADVAMYDAKNAGKGSFRFFDRAMEVARLEQRRVEDELRVGIAGGEVVAVYQPIVRLCDRRMCGLEILARWRHPRLGLLRPERFLGLAERTHQIGALTEALLRQACRDMTRLPPGLTMSLNVSPTQLGDPELAPRLLRIIRDSGHAPSRFEIELTEDAVMDDIDLVEETLDRFRAAGLSIALDDFGTGFSSLSNLQRLRFDRLKIDRSFLQDGRSGDGSRKIVEAVLHLAASFGMSVTAEGIESEETALMLERQHCANGQGHLFGTAQPIEAILARLAPASPDDAFLETLA